MGALEKSGLLYQPHTSAGRIPSDSGYRIYVDQLITPSETLGKEVETALQQRLHWEDWSLEALLQGAAQILATLSGCITLITMPQTTTAKLKHLQLVQMEAGKMMLIVVTDSYETHSKVMDLFTPICETQSEPEVIDHQLQIVSNFLNSHLRGRSLLELGDLNWSELDQEFHSYGEFLKSSLVELTHRALAPIATPIMVRGIGDSSKSKVTVRIGTENPLQPIRSCTLISSTYRRGSVPVGSVGVLGPTRLDYESAIAVVAAAADYLSEAFS
jgi:heat-inducible transcriptional repressor